MIEPRERSEPNPSPGLALERSRAARVRNFAELGASITAETAWLLSEAFGSTPRFWSNLQTNYDLATNRPERHVKRLKRAS